MTYEKPEIRDFGSIAEHTYQTDCGGLADACIPGYSGIVSVSL